MTVGSRSIALGFALMVAVLPASLAQGAADAEGQKPPIGQQSGDRKSPEQPKCVSSNTGFKQKGRAATFVIELQNGCEMRLKCTVDAYVVGARGPTQGHATLILGPKSKGASASKAYVMKVKSAGGMANVSHACKAI